MCETFLRNILKHSNRRLVSKMDYPEPQHPKLQNFNSVLDVAPDGTSRNPNEPMAQPPNPSALPSFLCNPNEPMAQEDRKFGRPSLDWG